MRVYEQGAIEEIFPYGVFLTAREIITARSAQHSDGGPVITAVAAHALLKITPPEQRTNYKPPQLEQPKGATL